MNANPRSTRLIETITTRVTGESVQRPTPHPDATVYLIQTPSVPKSTGRVIDTSPLLWFGKVQVLIEKFQAPGFATAETFNQIRNRLATFDPDKDYIAVAGGDSLGVMLVGAVLSSMGHDYCWYLRFERTRLPNGQRDPASGEYFPVLAPLTPFQCDRMLEAK